MTTIAEQCSADNTAKDLIKEWHDGLDRAVWAPDLARLQEKLIALIEFERGAFETVRKGLSEYGRQQREARQQAEQRAAEAESIIAEALSYARMDGNDWRSMGAMSPDQLTWLETCLAGIEVESAQTRELGAMKERAEIAEARVREMEEAAQSAFAKAAAKSESFIDEVRERIRRARLD